MAKKIERIKPSLEIEEHIHLHITGWIVQRIGWALMLLFIALAALGLFGDGILSRERLNHDGISIQYERFFRHEAQTEIRIQAPAATHSVMVELSPAFNRNYTIDRILPDPAERRIVNGAVLLTFPALGAADIRLIVEPAEVGGSSSRVAVNGNAFELSSFIYP